MSKVELAEMRHFLENTTNRTGSKERSSTFRNAPDWVVRRLYEVRKGLTLTPLPPEAHKQAEKLKRAANLTEQDKMKLRMIAEGL